MNTPTHHICRSSNRMAHDPESQLEQSQRPSLRSIWRARWRMILASALLLMMCGPASAQLVRVVGYQNGNPGPTANVHSVTGMDLDDSTTVLVVGLYGDNAASAIGFTNVTFGGVPPNGLIQPIANTTRGGIAYWINPNTAAGQTLAFTYTSPNQGYYWAYQLANVNTSAAVATTGPTIQFGTSASLTTVTNNSFVISFFSGNNAQTGLTPNPPLVQTAGTLTSASAGASIASATNTIPTPGLVNIGWNQPPGSALAQYGVGAIAFVPANVGAPIVAGSISPALTAPGGSFDLTVTIDPFHSGNITNVSVDLSSIGGTSVNALVQTANPNVWTNSFTVPGGAPIGTTNLLVTAMQDAAPFTGTGSVAINIASPSAPTLVNDTIPVAPFSMYAGQGVRFSASFAAPGVVTYRWKKSSDGVTYTDIPGANASVYTIPSATLGDTGFYQLQASNFLGAALSSPTFVSVNDASSALYIWSAPIPFGGLTAEQILTNFPSANKIAGAMVAQVGGNPISVVLTNAGNRTVVFAKDGNWASLSGGASYVANVNTNSTGNANFNSALNVGYNNNSNHSITMSGLEVGKQYQVQLFALDNRPGLTPAARAQNTTFQDPADTQFPQVTSEAITMADNFYMLGTFTANSTQMTIQQNFLGTNSLLGTNGNINALVLRSVGWDPAPYITLEPRNTNNFVGTRVSLTAAAAGDSTIASPTITYQWAAGPVGGPYTNLVEGTKYGGVTTTTVTISNLVEGDGIPVYVLKASNGGGTATSKEATVYVQSLPIPPPASSFGSAVLALTNVPNSRLAGFWQLNETNNPATGLLFAYDSSGRGKTGTYGTNSLNGYNGVLSPQPPTFGGFATNQGALQTGAAGAGDAGSVVNLPPLNNTNGVATTICMWINPTAVAPNLGGLIYNRGPDQCGFGFAGNTGGPSGQRNLGFVWNNLDGEATYTYNSGLFPVNNTWNFVVLVIRTNAATFYLNYVDTNGAAFFGKAADTAARYTTNTWAGGPIWIGGDPTAAGTTIFPGRISNVAVFNSALTDDQIYDLFVAGFQNAGFPASIIQQPPATVTNYAGYTLQLNAVPGGSNPMTNQWKLNGVNVVDGWYNGVIVTGSKSNVLTIQNVSAAYQGTYTLAVTNSLGGAVSSNSLVTIVAPVAPPSGNLVGRWFDGTASLADLSGFTAAGTHNAYGVGASATNYAFTNAVPPGKTGLSLRLFGGTSMGISNTLPNSLPNGDPGYQATFDSGLASGFSVAVWARGQPAAWAPFVSKNGETEGWQLRRSAGPNAVFTLRGTGGTIDPAGAAGGSGADGLWHHYVGTFDLATGTRVLYVDGIQQNVSTGDINSFTPADNTRLVLGGRSVATTTPPGGIDGGVNFTGGNLYDVRIYNVPLTGAQQAYLAAPPPATLPPQTLSMSYSPGNPGQLVLSWLNGGTLLQSTNVTGPWVPNNAATPPYVIPATNNPAAFFRVVFQ